MLLVRLFLCAVAVLYVVSGVAAAREYHVQAGAAADGDGSPSRPFETVQAAAAAMKPGDVCIIHAGVYRETIRPANSGTADQPLVFRATDGEDVVINGCERVDDWRPAGDKMFRAAVKLSLDDGNQVFSGRQMLLEARWPNAGVPAPRDLLEYKWATMADGTTPTKIVDPQLPSLDLAGAQVWVSSHKRWYCWTGEVLASQAGELQIKDNSDSKGNHICKPGGRYYVFGAKSLLDSPNEWYYDATAGELFVGGADDQTLPQGGCAA